jgi:putative SOS response-associated peptidase YedK
LDVPQTSGIEESYSGMCGHFAIDYLKLAQLIEIYALNASDDGSQYGELKENNDYYPARGERHSATPIILEEKGERILRPLRWDLVPSWWRKPLAEKKFVSFNARSDSLQEKATFKKAWIKGQRCLFPATSFYEWPDKNLIEPGIKRVVHKIRLQDRPVFSMAGIWDTCVVSDKDTPLRSCAIITVEANRSIADIPHTRMPAILKKEDEKKWLDRNIPPDTAFHMLRPYPAEACVVQRAEKPTYG